MSAYMVSKAHIDALVLLAIEGPTGVRPGSWYAPYFGNPSSKVTRETAHEVGQLLVNTNVDSLDARYPGRHNSLRYPYVFNPNAKRLVVVEAFKAIKGYEYQACEHEAWISSEAYHLMHALYSRLAHYLPGYDDAPWTL